MFSLNHIVSVPSVNWNSLSVDYERPRRGREIFHTSTKTPWVLLPCSRHLAYLDASHCAENPCEVLIFLEVIPRVVTFRIFLAKGIKIYVTVRRGLMIQAGVDHQTRCFRTSVELFHTICKLNRPATVMFLPTWISSAIYMRHSKYGCPFKA